MFLDCFYFFSFLLIYLIKTKHKEQEELEIKTLNNNYVIIQGISQNNNIIKNNQVMMDNLQENENFNYSNQNINHEKNKQNFQIANDNQSENTFLSYDKAIPEKDKKTNITNKDKEILNIDSYDASTIKSKINVLKDALSDFDEKKLKINLIFFYEKLTDENVDLYNRLKLGVLGGFFGVQNVDVLKKLLLDLERYQTSFILISTGSSFEKINKFCQNLNCITQIYIFCGDVEKYKKEYESNEKIFHISNNILEIIIYLATKSIILPDYDKNIKNEIKHNPLISYYEYENFYFINHIMLSFFFKDDFSILNFNEDYQKEIFEFIERNNDLDENQKNNLINEIIKLKDSKNFLKDSLSFFSSESFYPFSKTMRKIEDGFEKLCFLIGPMYYCMVRYLKKENPSLNLNKSTTLYRYITLYNEYDLNIYTMAVGNVICFSSFSSTSIKKGEFKTTPNATKVNKSGEDKISVNMILHYNHLPNNAPIGMFLGDLSLYPDEEEVLLFPFTFIKVNELRKINEKSYELDCNIINKDCILEFGLKQLKRVDINNGVIIIN